MAVKAHNERECRVSFKIIEGGVTAPKGFRASAVTCGIKNPEATRLDLHDWGTVLRWFNR